MIYNVVDLIINTTILFKRSTLAFVYFLIIKFIDFYSYVRIKLIKYLPFFIYVKTFTYRSSINDFGVCELDFDITEYKCNFNERFYTVRFINLDDKKYHMYNFRQNINKRIQDRNLIFHASIQKNNKGKMIFIKDVTEELRSFFHYIELDKEISSKDFIDILRDHDIWKYIKINIGLDEDYQLLVCLNDINMTDILIE